MTNKRASVFDDGLDLSGFEPKPPAKPQEVRELAEAAGFSSREPALIVDPIRREQRRYRTGRNVQISLKARQEDVDLFYQLAESEGVVLGEAFARAAAAWKKELSGS